MTYLSNPVTGLGSVAFIGKIKCNNMAKCKINFYLMCKINLDISNL